MLQPAPQRAPHLARKACGRRRSLPRELDGGQCPYPRGASADLVPVCLDSVGPPALDELLGSRRAGHRTEKDGAAIDLTAPDDDLAGMHVGRSRLLMELVPVVPADGKAEVLHRCERRRPRPDHHAGVSPKRREERPVPGSRAVVRDQSDVTRHVGRRRRRPRRDADLGQRTCHLVHVASRREHDERTSPSDDCGGHRLSDRRRPPIGAGAGQRRPHGTG
ncbi:hypothetical protein [Cellulomonas sp. P24]|uniref:hypothetical protein n=1 Tax=Cellulomonas sp. P24 TaxID=2885206 RepID=UPI00216B4040|nr:hypothetical protein [Cellulomonas sp. P24]MCR6494626.1 hypothetical protein [Cellulomonas sp. P24]